MGFGTDLQGRESHDALLHIQDTEIKLLENMKGCLSKRIDGDKKYLAALNSFVQLGVKLERTEYDEYCSVFKVSLILATPAKFIVSYKTDSLTSCYRALIEYSFIELLFFLIISRNKQVMTF